MPCTMSAGAGVPLPAAPASSYFQQAMKMALDDELDDCSELDDIGRDNCDRNPECSECSRLQRNDASATVQQHALANGEVMRVADDSSLRVNAPDLDGPIRCQRCAGRRRASESGTSMTRHAQHQRLTMRRKSSTDKGVQWADEQNKQLAREHPPKRHERKASIKSGDLPRPILKHP